MNLHRAIGLIAAAAFTLVTFTGISTLAHADSAGDTSSRTVRYDDLDLSAPAGVRALYRRIQDAAGDVCGDSTEVGSRARSRSWSDCVSVSIHDAVLAVRRPELTAFYTGRLREIPFRTAD
jgi:UrcA family protein